MVELEGGQHNENRSVVHQASIIAQFVIAITSLTAAVMFILIWLLAVALSFTPHNGLMPWVAAGALEFGLFFIFLAAIPGIPGIIWANLLVDQTTSPWNRILKGAAWIGKAVFAVGTIVAILILIIGIATAPDRARQSESMKTVAAFEVPLPSEADREEFLSVLRAAAELEHMQVYAESNANLASAAKAGQNFQMTMNAAVWRGTNDNELIATALDHFDHLGRIWLMFSRGEDSEINAKFQERAMHEIMLRWPNTLSLPVTPSGAIPGQSVLIRTPNGYVVKPSEIDKYGLTNTATQQK